MLDDVRAYTRTLLSITVLLVLGAAEIAGAQPGTVAFRNVTVIPMDRERIEHAQTVLVTGGRIAAVGADADVAIPPGASVIDGSGRYLVPGLTDAHVHLTTDMPWAPARADFGDAPLYLAHGVTTVINLRGTPEQLEWRRRIEAGELVGPTIYTAGEFVNEPRVITPEDVAQEIAAQRQAGYDLIKFHEVWRPGVGFLTTTGLSRAAYQRMNEAARAAGMPLVGHAPVNLGLETMLQSRQPLAHLGMLSNVHFLPLAANRDSLIVTAAALLTLTILAIGRRRSVAVWLAAVIATTTALLLLPGGPLFNSVVLRVVFTASMLVAAAASVAGLLRTLRAWRDGHRDGRWQAAAASLAGLAFAAVGVTLWLPVVWRSGDAAIESLAQRFSAARIPVQTTLVAYDAIGGVGRTILIDDPGVEYLRPDTRARWRQVARAAGPPGYRYTEFMKKVAGALHRAGVPLMAGTDAMGAPLIAPGSSLHRELQLLAEAGLTPYETIRAATVSAAVFLRQDTEFGTIEPGKRADLLLIEGNPLEDPARLRRPAGVMVRGTWLPRERLQEMLSRLAAQD